MEQGESRNFVGGEAVTGTVVQAGSIGSVHLYQGAAAPGADTASEEWVRRAGGSSVWRHVTAVDRDAGHHRRYVVEVVTRLAAMRDESEPSPEQDPWCDPTIAVRFLEHVEWLLGEPASDRPLDLYPAEASLLVLFPFLHRVHYLRRAAQLTEVGPWTLREDPNAGPERRSFEVFAEEGEALVQRALRDPEAEPLVGWWLFHRWLGRQQEFARADSVRLLLAELGPTAEELGDALAPDRVSALLHGLRRGPDLCHPEFLNLLPTDDRVRSGPGHQRIRFQRVALLVAPAYSMSIEMTTLPDIVAEHLAIPYPVDLAQLRRTLAKASWGGSHDLPVLRAQCHHEAVIEGLREYTARTDALLHEVRRTERERVTQPMPVLPTRLSTDGVAPTEGAFDGYARFRSDGRRVLDLAMGIQLYKDRDLAIRELYQNALDACRYRRARSEYLERERPASAPYTGEISFIQDVDEDGRPYVECQDNGVGMGEAELRGVFSHAGARFAEQLEFKLERAKWEALDPPVTLYPNSRFGIGVLSYFMLADEIRVTTCRMSPEGAPGPEFEVSICGPSHLFRIARRAERGKGGPGTRVRLYLRADVDLSTWSCIKVLGQVLALAEFATTARHGEVSSSWDVGKLKVRQQTEHSVDFDFKTFGVQLPWPPSSVAPQVIWCESGGALLVDGLFVEPQIRGGVLSRADNGLVGAVVNLQGPSSPARLSVDRTHVLDDVGLVVEDLLKQAVGALTADDQKVPNFEWLCQVADSSAALADMVTAELSSKGRELVFKGTVFGTPQTGVFPADLSFLPSNDLAYGQHRNVPWINAANEAPDHLYLWRILARRPRKAFELLVKLCPEIADAGRLLTPVPSDQSLLQSGNGGYSISWSKGPVNLKSISEKAQRLRRSSREVAQRLASLGFPEVDPLRWSDDAELTASISDIFGTYYNYSLPMDKPLTSGALMAATARTGESVTATAGLLRGFGFDVLDDIVVTCEAAEKDDLLWLDPRDRTSGCLEHHTVVSMGHIAKASVRFDLSVPEVCRRLESHGLRTDGAHLPDRPTQETLLLLSAGADRTAPWLDRTRTPPPGQVLDATEQLSLEPSEVLAKLDALGFSCLEPLPSDATADDLWLLRDESRGEYLTPPKPLSYGAVFNQTEDLEDLRLKITRMRTYGFTVTLEVPRRPTLLDREILKEHGPLNWWYVEMGDAVPFSYVLLAARELGATPGAVVKRLHACSIATSHDNLPCGLTFADALRLMRAHNLEDGDLPEAKDFPLEYLHKTALRKRTSIQKIAEQLRQLGIPVPDPAETIRAALARVPRPTTDSD